MNDAKNMTIRKLVENQQTTDISDSTAPRAMSPSEDDTLVVKVNHFLSKYEQNLKVVDQLYSEKAEMTNRIKALEKRLLVREGGSLPLSEAIHELDIPPPP